KFLAVFSTNLDEFFGVRVAGLKSRQEAGLGPGPDTGTPTEQLAAIRARAEELVGRQSALYLKEVKPRLEEAGIQILDGMPDDPADRKYLDRLFEDNIFPVLTPLAVDPGHPFPYISNLSLNLAIFVVNPENGERRFARLKVPPVLPRFLALPDQIRFVPLEAVIAAHLDRLFAGLEIEYTVAFRVTRNMDLAASSDEEAEDLLEAVEMELRQLRFGDAVRLEVPSDVRDDVLDLLLRELALTAEDVYRIDAPLDLGGLWEVYGLDRPDLKYEALPPVTPSAFEGVDGEPADVFAAMREGDILVHHPYESFAMTVQELFRQASTDPAVMAIKLTLYRTSGDSPIVKSLIRAAERGKQVAVLVELKARGDEQANVAFARAMEEAGIHVVYGLMGLKTHSKVAMIVRQEETGIRRYCHVGTGNYNPSTAQIYEDLGLLTVDPGLGADLTDLFNFLTGYSRQSQYRKLLVAPVTLRRRLIELINEQADKGLDGRIAMKLNHLVDPELIEAFYRASGQGTRIEIVARTRCSLRPGVPGLSDHISVRSIVGRFLEHSRLFVFGDRGSPDSHWFMGSADLMERNLDGRVEVLLKVETPAEQARLRRIIEVELSDRTIAWHLGPDGSWTYRGGPERVSAQDVLAVDAWRRSHPGRPDPVRLHGLAPTPEAADRAAS
ncbi:MAG TPA: polyphosphate kinase 1, partial [Acidimicrobiales bacterium]|nr:polyphosphate kinase 1 [Acidimicrobiales bacterium]